MCIYKSQASHSKAKESVAHAAGSFVPRELVGCTLCRLSHTRLTRADAQRRSPTVALSPRMSRWFRVPFARFHPRSFGFFRFWFSGRAARGLTTDQDAGVRASFPHTRNPLVRSRSPLVVTTVVTTRALRAGAGWRIVRAKRLKQR